MLVIGLVRIDVLLGLSIHIRVSYYINIDA
jgi:hypothetical protein